MRCSPGCAGFCVPSDSLVARQQHPKAYSLQTGQVLTLLDALPHPLRQSMPDEGVKAGLVASPLVAGLVSIVLDML